MNETNAVNGVLKTAEKTASIDLAELERKVKALDARSLKSLSGKWIDAIDMHSAERVEKRVQATLDIAYLLGNLGGWYSEKQEKRFEEIAANLGCKPSDVSPDAVGINAKLAHLRGRVSEPELLKEFLDSVRSACGTFDGMLVPSRRAFSLWIALGLSDGEMPELYRKALMLLRGEFKHSALLYGALGGLPALSAGVAAAGAGAGLVVAIMGGLKGLKYKQVMDRYCPLISDDFLARAEALILKMDEQERSLARITDPAEKERVGQEYALLSRQLQELIEPPSPDEEDEEEEEQ
ncbi:MAG: hypothetical protein J6331_09530 [Lentisphaeria bacterium]|nr:hypothetical protein [Lentisphaeria bacterium]